MKLGLLSACMPERSLEEVAAWAGANGYEALELAAWPRLGDRPFVARHVAADGFDEAEAERVRRALDDNGLDALGARLLRQQPASRPGPARGDPRPRARLHRRRRGARRRPGRHLHRPRQLAQRRRQPARGRARPPAAASTTPASAGCKLMIENCVMEGWHPDGYPGNLAYSPELWEWMFELGFWLNFDPSHLLWIGIDPVAALQPVRRPRDPRPRQGRRDLPRRAQPLRLLRPHLDPRVRSLGHGLVALPDPRPRRGRLAGATSTTLYEGGFDGVLSVEHEDPVWGGTPEKVEAGLELAAAQPATAGGAADGGRAPAAATVLEVRGLVKEYPGRARRCRGSTSRSSRARSTACSGPTAPASRP